MQKNVYSGNNKKTRNGKATAKLVGMIVTVVAIGAALFFLLGPLCRWISATTASAADFLASLGNYALQTWNIFLCWVLVLAILFGVAYLILRLILKVVKPKKDEVYEEEWAWRLSTTPWGLVVQQYRRSFFYLIYFLN